jgi:hypothetical protein
VTGPGDEPGSEPAEVLAGRTAELRWVVFAQREGDDLYTMLRVWSGDEVVVAGSGFGGPGLYPGSVVNEWQGRTDDLPYFVMARTVPEADRVVATTDRGLEIELALSEPVEQFGLRFAAAALPAGHRPGSIRAESGGTVLAALPQPLPGRPGRGGPGHRPSPETEQ